MAKFFFPKCNSTQFVNRNVKILGRRLYSPSLKDVAGLGRRGSREKDYRQLYGKLEKLIDRLLAKLHPSNLVNTIFYLTF
jgi:hypothetical protein